MTIAALSTASHALARLDPESLMIRKREPRPPRPGTGPGTGARGAFYRWDGRCFRPCPRPGAGTVIRVRSMVEAHAPELGLVVELVP